MDKKYCEDRIKEIKKSINEASANRDRADDHMEEGLLLLATFKEKLQSY